MYHLSTIALLQQSGRRLGGLYSERRGHLVLGYHLEGNSKWIGTPELARSDRRGQTLDQRKHVDIEVISSAKQTIQLMPRNSGVFDYIAG